MNDVFFGIADDNSGNRLIEPTNGYRAGNPTFSESDYVASLQLPTGVGWLCVYGTMGHVRGRETYWNIQTPYESIAQALKLAADQFDSLIVAVNSPGGYNHGLPELTRMIADYPLETFAWVDGMATSAGYWVAAACQHVFGTPSSCYGAIGTRSAAVYDYSENFKNSGVTVYPIASGKFKDGGETMGAPVAPEVIEFKRGYVDGMTEEFKNAIREFRPTLDDEEMEGQYYRGEDALERGFVDRLFLNAYDFSAALHALKSES